MKEKLKSKTVWLTAVPLIANLIAQYSGAASETFSLWMTTIVTLLALFGILNNPNDSEKF